MESTQQFDQNTCQAIELGQGGIELLIQLQPAV